MNNGVISRRKATNYGIIDVGGIEYGTMSAGALYNPRKMTLEKREKAFLKRRINLGEKFGFNGYMMFTSRQQDKNGSYKIIDEDVIKSNPDGCKTDIKEDILIVTTETPEVVIGHATFDYPVIMMTDIKKGFTAVAHCTPELIDSKLPMMIADSLLTVCGSRDQDIYAYVSATLGPDFSTNKYPIWARDKELWENVITNESLNDKNLFKINLRKAIAKQFEERNVLYYSMNDVDTITDSRYFSRYASNSKEIKSQKKLGCNFAGAYYKKLGR